MALKVVRPATMAKILAVIDGLKIHREAVRIPLAPVPGGALRIDKAALIVEAPDEPELEPFLASLESRIRALPGAAALKRAE
jgi:hypothetical protein